MNYPILRMHNKNINGFVIQTKTLNFVKTIINLAYEA